MDYEEFVRRKRKHIEDAGFTPSDVHSFLFPFQKQIVTNALKRGRYAIFAECGLGKTPMQLSWAEKVHQHTNKPVLILAPLAVGSQTVREGQKFGIKVRQTQDGAMHPITITNYEHVHKYDPQQLGGIVLDESSILKNHTGKYRNELTAFASVIPYRLSATATPAPNDFVEYGTQAEFLGHTRHLDMLAEYFVHDGGDTSKWRLKKHAVSLFKEWLSEWSVTVEKPSDIGFEDEGYNLPEKHEHHIDIEEQESRLLFEKVAISLSEQRNHKKKYIQAIAEKISETVNGSDDQFLIWIENNYEADAIKTLVPDAVEIRGSDKPEHKSNSMIDFSDGKIRVLLTKPSIAGFGMNWQQCHNMIFSSVGHSYEQRYQAERRCYRFGQKNDVHIYVVRYPGDDAVNMNYNRKTDQAKSIREKEPV